MSGASPQVEARTPSRIRKLAPLLVNQIAAGEVVDRPASVVKELLDNAIDARATRVVVELEKGGIELVRVTDDGVGIAAEDLPLALAPHATSKISVAEDLDRIGTMGFRGEALASIASVARMSIRTRTRGETGGEAGADGGAWVIEAEGETVGTASPAAGPVGTSVTVRNLFFNTPARRKFLRTASTEQEHCVDMARELALSHPGIGFVVACDGKKVVELAPGQTARERVLGVLGAELAEQFLEVGADEFDDARGVALWGMAGLPGLARATAKAQHVFLNGRPIRDKTIQHAIREAYRGLIEPGRYPTVVLMLEMDPSAVDVNVHPAKTEVRFRDGSMIHGVVLRALREALMRADLTPEAHLGARGDGGVTPPFPPTPSAVDPTRFVEYFKGAGQGQAQERMSFGALREALAGSDAGVSDGTTGPQGPPPHSRSAEEAYAPFGAPRPVQNVLQVHKSYVVTQDEYGLVIVDQHALHERSMFEQLITRVRAGNLEAQRLLVPVVVPAKARQIERLEELRGMLEKLGIVAEALGPASVGVHSFPTFLFDRKVDAGEFMHELLERADDEGFAPNDEQTLHEVLDMMACKAAVKAGDRLSEGELMDLLRMREQIERSSNCPHGRPTSIRVTIRELEKRFGRA
jgi:DNA mismatch repair protein MutL